MNGQFHFKRISHFDPMSDKPLLNWPCIQSRPINIHTGNLDLDNIFLIDNLATFNQAVLFGIKKEKLLKKNIFFRYSFQLWQNIGGNKFSNTGVSPKWVGVHDPAPNLT